MHEESPAQLKKKSAEIGVDDVKVNNVMVKVFIIIFS